MKYAWIETQRRTFPLPVLCDALSVSQSGFRAWQAGGGAGPQATDRRADVDADPHDPSGGSAGVRRTAHPHRVARARHKRRYKATTDSRHNLPVAANVLGRDFTPDAPNRVWTGDITYIATAEGWLYLAVVIDLFNREVIGWSIKSRMTTDLVLDALSMAWFRRRPQPGVLFHSDRGSQYASHA